jgi:hypothetical protein
MEADALGEIEKAIVRSVPGLAQIDARAWDACANPQSATANPFVSHAFLAALEEAGTVGPGTGWNPHHLVIEDGFGGLHAALPLYVKGHSQGEYVFDHAWADAFHRAGGQYYPKLQCAIPFTPVPGRRLLVRPGPQAEAHEIRLVRAAQVLASTLGASSIHITFATEGEWDRLGRLGFLRRMDQQFHWRNAGYRTFDDFLATLSSRKRKAIRKERAQALAPGIDIEHVRGAAITEGHWDSMFDFYMDTGSRKWGRPYLNRRFFSLLGERMADQCLLVFAERRGRRVAGALHVIGGDCLYGRYWGAIEHHPCLHFEVCYYQAIQYAIAQGLARVEAGAQGEHKLARGYLPAPTYSLHWFAEPRLAAAVARYIEAERAEVAEVAALLAANGPYKRSTPLCDT